ncbi:AMP-binding protein [Ralstonia syzygii]|uniref:AMP-binding protein n=1 Tax=Ralstonia syzygii TaxID=28097 RepID=UPI002E1BEF38
MLQRMAADPALGEIDKSSLVALVSGGSVIDEASVARCKSAFDCAFISLYGSADGVNCHRTLDDDAMCNRVGRPNPSICEISIVDDTGQEVSSGEVGEIVARGPMSRCSMSTRRNSMPDTVTQTAGFAPAIWA